MLSGSVGERIAAYRRRRGLSQAALAGLIGRSESWLSQVERGVRSVDRLSVLLDMAKVLHVEIEALTGRPWQYAPNGGLVAAGLDQVRHFFARYDNLLGTRSEQPSDVASVLTRVTAAHRAYQAAEYDRVVYDLPALLRSADDLHRRADDSDRREALAAYVSAYAVAARLLTKMGAADLALLSADRAATAAVDSESLEARGMARPSSPTVVSLAGALWLISAIIAARRTDRAEAWRRLDRAGLLAGMLGRDANFAWTAFGPTNVAIHRVSAAAELGDPAEALRASDAVDPDLLPAGLKSRRAQVHLDLAWAQVQRKRDADALLHLMEVERVVPEVLRYNVMVRELVREMLVRQKRSKTSALHSLAVRAGVLD